MIEFDAELYPLSGDTCCYCDEKILVDSPRAKFQPYGGGGDGVYVQIQLTFCERCVNDIMERCEKVLDDFRRHRPILERNSAKV